MKRFLKMIGIFGAVLFLLATGLDYMITSGLRQSDNRKYVVWNDIYRGGIDADVLILGSSRAWCAYNTYIIDSVLNCNSYNLGIDGHTFEYQILRYSTYCRFNKKPKMVLLNVDFYSTLGSTSDAQYEREQFFPYITDGTLISQVAERKHLTLLDRYVPLYRYIGYRDEFETGMRAFLGKKHGQDAGLYKGYRGNEWTWSEPAVDSQVHVLEAEDDTMLRDFVSELRADGIEVVLVKEPFHDWMYEHYQGIEYTDRQFQQITDMYDCLLLDYYHCDLSHDTQYFYNPSHLNKRGGDLFTIRMCNDIIHTTK